MGRKSKVWHSRIQNLAKSNQVAIDASGAPGNVSRSPRVSMEEIPDENDPQVFMENFGTGRIGHLDSDDELDFDFESESDSDSDSDDLEVGKEFQDEMGELEKEAAIAHFSETLRYAQKAAIEAEKLRKASQAKRPSFYSKNSKRTKQRRKVQEDVLKKNGFQSISSFFSKAELAKEPEAVSEEEEEEEVKEVESKTFEASKVSPAPHQLPALSVHEHFLQMLSKCCMETQEDKKSDEALTNWRNLAELQKAAQRLKNVSKNEALDIVNRGRVIAMLGTLNIFIDEDLNFTWKEASLMASKISGHGEAHARSIRTWIHQYLQDGRLPSHRYGMFHTSMLDDEDLAQALKLHLLEVREQCKYIRAQDVVDFVSRPELQESLGVRPAKISVRTGRRWLNKMSFQYGKRTTGMYIDGHEREDVVQYCVEFCKRWAKYEKRMVTYDNDGNEMIHPPTFPVPQTGRFRLILVTHDESTFFAADRCKSLWTHTSEKAVPERKGEGRAFMISDFLTSEWGRLRDNEE